MNPQPSKSMLLRGVTHAAALNRSKRSASRYPMRVVLGTACKVDGPAIGTLQRCVAKTRSGFVKSSRNSDTGETPVTSK
jgi:hypothetical protein